MALSDGDGAYLALNKITELNVEYEQVLKIIISVFHQISLHQQLQNSEDVSIQQLAENLDPQIIQLHYEIALNALSKFNVHPHPKQALELCILRMLAFQPLSEGAAPKIEKKNSKLAAKSVAPSPRQVKAKEPAREEPKPVAAFKAEDIIEESIAESSNIPSELDMQSWNSIFNSLNLSMFVSQVFSEFEFVSFTDSTLTLKKSDELINPTEGLKTEFLEAISRFVGQKVTKENIGRLTSLVKPNHRGYALRARSLEYEESFDLRGVIESVKNGCMIGRVASAHSNEPIVVEAWVDGLRVKEREFDLAGHGLEDWTSISFEIGNKLVKRSHSLQLTFGQDGRDFDNSPFTSCTQAFL